MKIGLMMIENATDRLFRVIKEVLDEVERTGNTDKLWLYKPEFERLEAMVQMGNLMNNLVAQSLAKRVKKIKQADFFPAE